MKKLLSLIVIVISIQNSRLAIAQVIPDNSLGAEKSVVSSRMNVNGIPSILIKGGAFRGTTVFHSLLHFDIPSDTGAFFQNPSNISTIITRVTGGRQSNLLGQLGVLGKADLFLINPSGIFFGPNSSLSLNGSFLATSADSISLQGGNTFSASDPKLPPDLKVSIPLGLGFGNDPKPIINKSSTSNSSFSVQPGKTLALIGGNILFEEGSIIAPSGNIELGSVGRNSHLQIRQVSQGWELDYKNVHDYRDIYIDKSSVVSIPPQSTDGRISINGKNLTISNGSQVFATNSEILVNLSDTLRIEGFQEVMIPNTQIILPRPSLITNDTLGSSSGKSTIINAKNVFLKDRGRIDTGSSFIFNFITGELTVGTAQGGELILNASELIEISGEGSALNSNTSSKGRAGNIRVKSKQLLLREGGRITASSASTTENFGLPSISTGPAGRIFLDVLQSITISGVSSKAGQSSGLFSTSSESSTGLGGTISVISGDLVLANGGVISARTKGDFKGGDISIRSKNLSLINGGQISTSTFGIGSAGNIKLSVSDRILLSGSDPSYIERFNQFGNPLTARLTLDPVSQFSGVFASSELGSTGDAGSINIDPRTVVVRDGAGIFVDSKGSGIGGSIFLESGNLILDNGTISATSNSDQGGDLTLVLDDFLFMRGQSLISANAGSLGQPGDGGNISISADYIVSEPDSNSDIIANSFEGRGGRININARRAIFGFEVTDGRDPRGNPANDISAISLQDPQLNGQVDINSPEVDPSENLPEQTVAVEPPQEIAKGCRPGQTIGGSTFTHVGRGGLPIGPYEAQTPSTVWQDLRAQNLQPTSTATADADSSPISSIPNPSSSIVEAKGWSKDSQGRIYLTANVPQPVHSPQLIATC